MNRYARQMILPGFGPEMQEKISTSRVLVVGAGGLGIPVLQYLSALGVGVIGIADGDKVELSNLQRQVLYNPADINASKALTAKRKLQLFNDAITYNLYDVFIDQSNVFEIVSEYDIVVDCTDHFSIRYLLNDVCCLYQKPLVFASVFRYEAQLSVFHYGDNGCNLRDIFETIPDEGSVANCNEAGVIGSLVGIVGSMQATEVMKIITGIGEVNSGKLCLFNCLDYSLSQWTIGANLQKFVPRSRDDIATMDYGFSCDVSNSIDHLATLERIIQNENGALIDVREVHEWPKITTLPVIEIPLGKIDESQDLLSQFDSIVFVCQSGIRSKKALDLYKNNLVKKWYHVKNGMAIFE